MASRGEKNRAKAGQAAGVSQELPATDALSSVSVEKIMSAIETLGAKKDTQTAAIHKEIASIRQELHSTVSSLQSASSQNAKRIDDVEAATSEWSSSVMTLESTVKRLQSDVCGLKEKCLDLEGRSRRQNIRLVGIEEGSEGGDPRQFCAAALKEILALEDTPRLDRGHRSLAQKPREGERPRPFIMRVHHGDVKDRILRLSSQKKQLFYKGKRVFIFPDFAPEIAKKRAAFTGVKRLLYDIPNVRFGLRFPATLRITLNGVEKSFEDPGLAMTYVKEKIIPPS